ncbi:hypothetical protein HPB48_014509 [Haemaphysalis longicornis]|uniref:Cuticle protein n=1 Tax=Haemaphysalis longicornis TaxID=44386 RepID=A0A9J6F942_HAELO|nr:hypothetical protein HPB48_014509 [Haemaphysalis longicornis]
MSVHTQNDRPGRPRDRLVFLASFVLACLLRGSSGRYLQSLEPHSGYQRYGLSRPYFSPSWPAPNVAEPYKFGYNLLDYQGNQQYRYENSDHRNTKTGTYGYRDVNGIFRHVNYIADRHGFRVVVNTNEPGTAPANPADAVFNSAPIRVAPVKAPRYFAPAENIWYQGLGNAFGRRIGSANPVPLAKGLRRPRRMNRRGRRLVRKRLVKNRH